MTSRTEQPTRGRTKRRMVLAPILLGLTLAALSLAALSQASVFDGREASAPWGEKGTRLLVGSGTRGPRLVVRQSVAPRLEIVAEASASELFDLQASVLVVRDLHPLSIAVRLAAGRVSLLSSLFLGPVGLDIGRTWGSGAARWADLWFAPHPQLTLGLGIEETGGRIGPEIAFRWRPACAPHGWIAFRAGIGGPEISIGVWR